jgi:hypothetical protein
VAGESGGVAPSTCGGSGTHSSEASHRRMLADVVGCNRGRIVSTTHAALGGRPTMKSLNRRPG